MITLGFYTHIDNHPKLSLQQNLTNLEDTPANSIVLIPYNKDELKQYEQYNTIIGVFVKNIGEFIAVSKCNVQFAICDYSLALIVQKIADNYLYDTKVLAKINTIEEIEKAALDEIDGVYKV
jgi:hypothetical protein